MIFNTLAPRVRVFWGPMTAQVAPDGRFLKIIACSDKPVANILRCGGFCLGDMLWTIWCIFFARPLYSSVAAWMTFGDAFPRFEELPANSQQKIVMYSREVFLSTNVLSTNVCKKIVMYSREVFLSTNVHIRTQKDFPGIHVPKMLGTTGMDRFCWM